MNDVISDYVIMGAFFSEVFFFFFFFLCLSFLETPGNRNFYLMSHSIQLPPARDLGPGVIILQYLKSKEDSICVLT